MDTYQFENTTLLWYRCLLFIYSLLAPPVSTSHSCPYYDCNFFSTLSSPRRNFYDRMILVWLFKHQLNLLRHCPPPSLFRIHAHRISLAKFKINTDIEANWAYRTIHTVQTWRQQHTYTTSYRWAGLIVIFLGLCILTGWTV